MSRMGSHMTEFIARLLDEQEREAVLGDLRELGVGQGRAVAEILGLVARRQAAPWVSWHPWFTLLGLIAPLALLLSIVARQCAGQSSVYFWLYLNNFDIDLLRNRGFWYELTHSIPLVLNIFLQLFGCSWTVGFVVGSISKRAPGLNRALFVFALLPGFTVGAPMYLDWRWRSLNRVLHSPALSEAHAALSAGVFYRFIFPAILVVILVAAPSLWGLREGLGANKLGHALRVTVWIICGIAIARILEQNTPLWLLSPSHVRVLLRYLAYVPPASVLLYWPVLYLLGKTAVRRVRPKAIAC